MNARQSHLYLILLCLFIAVTVSAEKKGSLYRYIQNTSFEKYEELVEFTGDKLLLVDIRIYALNRLVDLYFSVNVGLVMSNHGKEEIFKAVQGAALVFRKDKGPYNEFQLRQAACDALALFDGEKGGASIETMRNVILTDPHRGVIKACIDSLGKMVLHRENASVSLKDFVHTILTKKEISLEENFLVKASLGSLSELNLQSSFKLYLEVLRADAAFSEKREAHMSLKKMDWASDNS